MMLLALSAAGVPIGIVVLRRLGRLGGLLLEGVIGALWLRACAMLTAGTARRLRLLPLLYAETALDGLATLAGFWAWVWRPLVRPLCWKGPVRARHDGSGCDGCSGCAGYDRQRAGTAPRG